jgi:pSer/pThr/pTyr-binding forkhead associated (FHA) protein
MMLRAFETGRDTQEMWRRLQMNCLLMLQEKQAAQAQAQRKSLLGQRLRGEAAAAEAAATVQEAVSPSSPPIPAPVQEAPTERASAVEKEPVRETKQEIVASPRYCLSQHNGQHRITLPTNGEIVLGRFDAATHTTPDVDLSYDDRDSFAISRRHARIIGNEGRHEIEDMGSTNGTRVNGIRLNIGQRAELQPGDRISLGYCEFVYVPVPEVKISLRDEFPQAYLWSMFTGQRFPLPEWGEAVVGRSDLSIGLTPDVDLSQTDEAAYVVARRHVKIVARSGRHYLEDLGSANGTKVNGVHIKLGELRLLDPGDHIWLGGCVLAYDIEG